MVSCCRKGNDSTGEEAQAPALEAGKTDKQQRIASSQATAEDEEELESEPDKKRTKK